MSVYHQALRIEKELTPCIKNTNGMISTVEKGTGLFESLTEYTEDSSLTCRVQYVRLFIALSENLVLLVPCLGHDLFVDLVTSGQPFTALGAGKRALISDAETWRRVRPSTGVQVASPYLGRRQPIT